MNLRKIALLFAACSLLTVGCDDKDDPKLSDDNFITALTVTTVDNGSYAAAIDETKHEIVLTVPSEVSLNGATAKVEYSEGATLSPDPATVEDWSAEQTFTVTSASGRANEYKYYVVNDDFFITSMVLKTADGTTYTAAIEGNSITITVPVGTSLEGAAAEFEYSEGATLSPDPATVEDWSKEQKFTVTSVSGRTNEYVYSIIADDNMISSVVVTTADGDSYTAAIDQSKGEIVLTVPYTVSLDGATAVFTYAETATLIPDPASITNWEQETQFRVTSVSGTTNDYKYLVVKDEIRSEGDVVLTSDAEMAAFSATGTSIITGNLIVGAADGSGTVSSLSTLSAVKEIGGKLIVNKGFTGTSLEGLGNLTKLGGLQIGSTEAVSIANIKTIELPKVVELGEAVVCNDNVQTFAFDALTRAESITLRSKAIKTLKLDNLAEVTGRLELMGSNNGSVDTSLGTQNAGGNISEINLPALTTVGGEVEISYFNSTLRIVRCENLTAVGAFLMPTVSFQLKEVHLPKLSVVNGDLTFTCHADGTSIGGSTINSALTSFDMDTLTSVKGCINISAFGSLTHLPDFSHLTTLGGVRVNLCQNMTVTEVDFSHVAFTGDNQFIINNTSIEKITGPESAAFTYFSVYHASALKSTTICGFKHLTCPDITTFLSETTIWEDLETVEGTIHLRNTLRAHKLTTVKGDLDASTMKNKDVAPNLVSVTGNIMGGNAEYLSLQEVGGDCSNCKNLASLTTVGGKYSGGAAPVLKTVGGDCGANGLCPVLKSVGGQMSKGIYGSIRGEFFPELEEIGMAYEGEYALELMAGSVDDPDITVLGNFPKLRRLGKGLRVYSSMWSNNTVYNESNTTTLSLPALESINGEFRMEAINDDTSSTPDYDKDDFLTTLDLPRLASVQSVYIDSFSGIEDFSVFKNVPSVFTESTWSIKNCGYNPTWEDMKNGKYTQE